AGRPGLRHCVDVDALHADAAARDAAADLHAGIERHFDRLLIRRHLLRAKRLRRIALPFEDDVVLSFLQTHAESSIAGGGDAFVIASLARADDHASDLRAERIALRFRGVDGDAGERLAVLVGDAAAEGDAARNHQRDAALPLTGSEA